MNLATSSTELGQAIRTNRLVRGLTLSEMALTIGCQRQTLADLEAGKNVGIHLVFAALAILDKGLLVADKRPELERLKEMFDDAEN